MGRGSDALSAAGVRGAAPSTGASGKGTRRHRYDGGWRLRRALPVHDALGRGAADGGRYRANAVLTFGLLWVYTEMADVEARQADVQERQTGIQRRQTDIRERQEAWMEANHAPVVRVERFGSVPLGSDDGCRVTVRNDGNGLAKDVCLRWEVRVGDDALHLDAQGDVTGVRWLDPNGEDFELVDPDDPSPLVRRQKTASGRPMASGNPVLGACERAKLFVGATFRPTDVVALDPDAVPSFADEGAMGMGMPGLFDALAADGFAEARVTVRALGTWSGSGRRRLSRPGRSPSSPG